MTKITEPCKNMLQILNKKQANNREKVSEIFYCQNTIHIFMNYSFPSEAESSTE